MVLPDACGCCASVGEQERIAGPIVNIVIAVVFVSALFMWRVEYNATGATITTFRDAIWWAIVQRPMTW